MDRRNPADATILRAAALIVLREGPGGRADEAAWKQTIRRLNDKAAELAELAVEVEP